MLTQENRPHTSTGGRENRVGRAHLCHRAAVLKALRGDKWDDPQKAATHVAWGPGVLGRHPWVPAVMDMQHKRHLLLSNAVGLRQP